MKQEIILVDCLPREAQSLLLMLLGKIERQLGQIDRWGGCHEGVLAAAFHTPGQKPSLRPIYLIPPQEGWPDAPDRWQTAYAVVCLFYPHALGSLMEMRIDDGLCDAVAPVLKRLREELTRLGYLIRDDEREKPVPLETLHRWKEVRRLFWLGKTNDEIAKAVGASSSTVRRDLKDMGLRRRKR